MIKLLCWFTSSGPMLKRWMSVLAIVYIVVSFVNIVIHFEQLIGCATKNDHTITSPPIYIVTPTHLRQSQKADLIRLSQTLLHLSRIHWIVVEDSAKKNEWIDKFLEHTASLFGARSFRYTHLNVETPEEFKVKPGKPKWKTPRGVWQRNEALRYLLEDAHLDDEGVVYFADDDNTYDLRLFDEIRSTKLVSIFPVGIVGGLFVEKPLVQDGKVIAFNAKFKPERTFPTDMAGFAVSLRLLKTKSFARFSENVPIGFLETRFLEQLLEGRHQLEPKAEDCTQILVWHTRTKEPVVELNKEQILMAFNE